MNRNLVIGLLIIAGVLGYESLKNKGFLSRPASEAPRNASSSSTSSDAPSRTAGAGAGLEMSPAGGMPLLAQAAAKKDLEAARAALARRDYDAARGSYSRFLQTELDRYKESGPREVAEWYLKAKADYEAALDREMDRLVEGVKTGEAPLETAQMFARDYSGRGRQLEERLDRLKNELDRTRARMAVGWVRAWYSVQDERFRPLVEKALSERFGSGSGLKLVSDQAMGERERRATWGTLGVLVELHKARSRFAGGSERQDWIHLPGIPDRVTVKLKLEGTRDIPTSWDKLAPVSAGSKPPETLRVDKRNPTDSIEKSRIYGDQLAALERGLGEALAGLPAFELYPGRDISLRLDPGDPDLHHAAKVMAVKDPGRFLGELERMSKVRDPKALGDVALAAIQAHVEGAAPWVVKTIPKLEAVRYQRLVGSLGERPWYGDFEPAMEALRSPPAGSGSSPAHFFRGWVNVPKVKDALLVRIKDPQDRERVFLATFFIQQTEKTELSRAGDWMLDPDERFAKSAVHALHGRDPGIALQLIKERFTKAKPGVQAKMLDGLNLGWQEPDPGGLAILETAIGSEDVEIAKGASRVLGRYANKEVGWAALRGALARCRHPGVREKVRQSLLQYPSAAGEQAEPFLRKQLLHLQEVIVEGRHGQDGGPRWTAELGNRDTAIGSYLGLEGEQDRRIILLASLIRSSPKDLMLQRRVLMAMKNTAYRRAGWDFDQPEVAEVLRLGLKHPDNNARMFAYQFMGKALEKGKVLYLPDLRAAGRTEKDKLAAEALRKAMKKAPAGGG